MAYKPIRTTAEVARRLLIGQTREDDFLEFKADPPYKPNDDGKRECARDVAQFANASGGSLVIGAMERNHVLHAFQDVTDAEKLAQWIGSVVTGQLEPVPPAPLHLVPAPGGERLLIVNVPPSPVLIARRTGKGYEFPIREGETKRYMTLLEVEARMENRERLMKLRLEEIRQEELVSLDVAVPPSSLDLRECRVTKVSDHTVTIGIGSRYAEVPLTYVEAVYRTSEQGTAWVIAMNCHLAPAGNAAIRVRKFTP